MAEPAAVRLREPVRDGSVVWRLTEDSLPLTHPARLLWEVLGTFDLSAFTAHSRATTDHRGRSNHSTRLLLTLWLYGLCQGMSSARKITRQLDTDFAFRWIAGDMSVCHDRLSRLRSDHRVALDDLFTTVVGQLLHHELLSLDLAAQDGVRVRAHAGAASFRSARGLASCEEQARLHLRAVLAQQDDPALTTAQKARRLNAAKDFQARVEEAKRHLASLPAPKPSPRPARPRARTTKAKKTSTPRASTTDPEARVMKMADGGFRPAYNLHLTTVGSALGGPRTVIGVLVSNIGSDMGSLVPMLDEVQRRTGRLPTTLWLDTNHAKHSDIEQGRQRGVRVLVPEMESSYDKGTHVHHSPELDAWRADMATDEAKELYRARAGLCEVSNADLKGRHGMSQLLVRGMGNVFCATLLAVLSTTLLQHAAKLLA